MIAEYNDTKGEDAARAIREEGGKAAFIHTDVTDQSQIEAAIDATVDSFGSVDILVNNAYSGGTFSRAEAMADSYFHGSFAINLFGPRRRDEPGVPAYEDQSLGPDHQHLFAERRECAYRHC